MITEIACRVMEEVDSCMQKVDPHIIEKMIIEEMESVVKDVDESVLRKIFSTIHGANRIFFQGVGRQMLVIKYFAQPLMHLGYKVFFAGDITCPAIKKGDVFVVVSATGEEEQTLRMVQKCKEIGDIDIILVTAAKTSSIRNLSDITLQLNAPVPTPEEDHFSVQPYGSLFEQGVLFVMDCGMSHYFVDRLGVTLRSGNPMHANLQ